MDACKQSAVTQEVPIMYAALKASGKDTLGSCLCVMSEAIHGCVQLTAEGGWDAAQEAPFLYAAMDALAARAGTWAERRQRLRIEAASEQAASTMAEPVVVSREAIAFVKQVPG